MTDDGAAPPASPAPPLRVVVTGAESTGKTTLAAMLARRFRTAWSPERARAHAAAKAREARAPLDAGDVEPIARGQIAGEERAIAAAAARGARLVVQDTDLVSTAIYARHHYGACPAWIDAAARDRRAALYLLCHPDVPWVADGVRDRPEPRAEIHARFAAALDALAALGAAVVPVVGGWEERDRRAIAAVDALLGAEAARRA